MNRRLYKKIFRVPQKSFYIFAFFALAVFIFVFIPRPALATIDGLTEDSSKIIISGGASTITISGTLYLDEGLTPLGSKTIKVAIGTSTPGVFSTTADGGGVWSVDGSIAGVKAGIPIVAWVEDGGTTYANTLTKASSTANITGVNLFKDRVIVKHEGFTATSTTYADMAFYNGSNNSNIRYTATGNAINIESGMELYVAPGSEFAPGSGITVTTHSNGGSSSHPSGNFHLASGLRQNGVATTSIFTLGGAMTVASSWFASSTSIFNHGNQTVTLNATTTGKSIYATTTLFYNLTFNGSSGGWTFGGNASTTNNFTITSGTVTAPSLLTIGGSFANNAGVNGFTANSSTIYFTGTGKTHSGTLTGNSALNNVIFAGGGTTVLPNASTTNFTISAGATVQAPSLLTIAGNYSNSNVFTAGSNAVYFIGSGKTISGNLTSPSNFNNVFFTNSGSWTFQSNVATNDLTITSGTLTAPSGGNIAIAGNYANNAGDTGFVHNSGTVQFTGTSKTLSGTMTGNALFNNLQFLSGTGWTFYNNASTTNFTITSGTVIASTTASTVLTIAGIFANSGTFTSGFGTGYPSAIFFTGASKTHTGTMTNTSALGNVIFAGSGTTIIPNASTTDFTINSGALVQVPSSGLLTIAGNYTNSGDFTDNSGTVYFTGTAKTLTGQMTGTADDFYNVVFLGTYTIAASTNASTTNNLTINSGGSLAAASNSVLTIGGVYANSGTFSSNNSTIYFTGASKTHTGAMTNTSALGNVVFAGSGTTIIPNASTTDFTINSGALVQVPASGLLTIAGNYTNSGDFTDNSGTVYFTGTAKTLAGQMTGTTDDFYNVVFLGTYTFSNNASTTSYTINSGASTTAPALLSISGSYTNEGVFNANAGTVFISGSSAGQTLTGNMIGGSAFYNLNILNSAGTDATTSPSVIFSGAASTTATLTISIASVKVRFADSAQYTFQNISLNGQAAGTRVMFRSSTPGAPWYVYVPGSQSVIFTDFMDTNASLGAQIDATGGTNRDSGNNTNILFITPNPTISSAANQVFIINGSSQAISLITITEHATNPTIKQTSGTDFGLRLAIATSTASMLWDTSDLFAIFGGTASTTKVSNAQVSYEGNGSVLVIEVAGDFAADDTLTISGLSFTSFTDVNAAASVLQIYKNGQSDIVVDATDDKTVAIKGTLVKANHSPQGQQTNKFDTLDTSVTNKELFNFRLTRAGEDVTINSLTLSLSDIRGIVDTDITGAALYYDFDDNGLIDGGDTAADSAADSVAISGTTGTIVFSGFIATSTPRNYILRATVANLQPGDQMIIGLLSANISCQSAITALTIAPSGSVIKAIHVKTGGFASGVSVGAAAPAGAGTQTDGTVTGGTETGETPPPTTTPEEGAPGGGGGDEI